MRAMTEFAQLLVDLVDRGRTLHPEISSRPLDPLMARGLVGAITDLIEPSSAPRRDRPAAGLVDVTTEMLWRLVTHVEPSNAGSAPEVRS